MNKRMRDLYTQIETKTNEAKSFMDGENKDVAKASEIMNEVDALKEEFAIEEKMFNTEKMFNSDEAQKMVEEKKKESTAEEFAKAVRMIAHGQIKDLSAGVLENGGYIVPEDIQTKVEYHKEAEFDLKSLVDVEVVSTNKGARTYQKKSAVAGLVKVDEGGAIPKHAEPKFERVTYSIEDHAGIIPVTNDLIEDANPTGISEVVSKWLARASVASDNAEILAAIETKSAVDLVDMDGIKKAINVTLGQAYAPAAVIVTNDEGLNYLDSIKDENGRYMLNPDPTAPAVMRLRVGANLIPIHVVPNSVLATKESKVPFIVGDMKEAIKFFDRKKFTLNASDVATVGGVSAFENNLTFFRAIERIDVAVKDVDAFVNGYITLAE